MHYKEGNHKQDFYYMDVDNFVECRVCITRRLTILESRARIWLPEYWHDLYNMYIFVNNFGEYRLNLYDM